MATTMVDPDREWPVLQIKVKPEVVQTLKSAMRRIVLD
jgi:hypothetical protein